MAFIRSLFCFSGRDNSLRFILISLSAYTLLCAAQGIFIHLPVLQIVLALLLIAIVTASSVRRCSDSGLQRPIILVPVLIFIIASALIIFTDSPLRYAAVVPGMLAAGLNLLWPAKSKETYIQGYAGPVDLSVYQGTHGQQHRQQRVEPSMFGAEHIHHEEPTAAKTNGAELYEQTQAYASEHRGDANRLETTTTPELDLSQWRKPMLIGASVISVLLVIVLIMSLSNSGEEAEQAESEQQTAEPVQQATDYVHRLEMPDNFTLMLDNHQALTIYWQADEIGDGEIWSLKTAMGDKSCSIIDFDRGKSIRSVEVNVKAGGDYYAQFSPLDTAELVKNIAGRNRFKLCGYPFSLKGSQAKLTYDPVFEPFL